MREARKRLVVAQQALELGLVYINDGGLHEGSRLLREAADGIESFARERDAILDELVKTGRRL
jgi:hypothetical protein